MKKRIDLILVDKKLAESREKAKEMIKWGNVFVDGKLVDKPSRKIEESLSIEIKEPIKYVSRAGYKLEKALNEFRINIKGKICLDVGSSTGGFVDCLLQKDAKKIYALEIAEHQLHKKLRDNKKVINMEGIDVRQDFNLPEKIDFCSIDVTFVSIKDVLLRIRDKLKKDAEIVALVKPPFEVDFKKGVKKIKSENTYVDILDKLKHQCKNKNFEVVSIIDSPIEGKSAKQKEFLMHLKLNKNL